MKTKLFSTVLVLFLTTILGAQTLTWTGCGITKKAFMTEISKAYETKTGVKTTLSGGGATKGIRSVATGNSDLGGSCRHRLVDGSGTVNTKEVNAKLVQVAWDAIVVITNPDNPVKNISLDDLKKVFDGKIKKWDDLGWKDGGKIALCTREGGKTSGVGHMFRRLVYNDPDKSFKGRSLKFKSSGPLEQKVETVKTALGITGISSAKKRNVNMLLLDKVKPTKTNIGSGKYPLWRPLYLTMNKNVSEKVQNFVDFILSAEGQSIIAKAGTVNLVEGSVLKSKWDSKKSSFGL